MKASKPPVIPIVVAVLLAPGIVAVSNAGVFDLHTSELVALRGLAAVMAATTRYVKPGASGAGGTSWSTAGDLQATINASGLDDGGEGQEGFIFARVEPHLDVFA